MVQSLITHLRLTVKHFKSNWLVYTAFLFVVGLWLANLLLLRAEGARGTFGDMFGAVNALFSGLAFMGVIYAILLQSRELRQQREELKLTRTELRGQKEQLAAQNESLRLQTFENTFFQMLRLHNELLASIDLIPGYESKLRFKTEGRDCFKVFYSRFVDLWNLDTPSDPAKPDLVFIDRVFIRFHSELEHDLSHYFRSLCGIIEFIDESSVDNKLLYSNIVRSQLSTYELLLLFYYGLSNKGAGGTKRLVEKYALLKPLDKEKIRSLKVRPNFYEDGAFAQ